MTEVSNIGDYLCTFDATVTFMGERQNLNESEVKVARATVIAVQKPADTITLSSVCGNSQPCVFNVIEPSEGWPLTATGWNKIDNSKWSFFTVIS